MLDFDAHHGEPDAREAALWTIETYFPGAYDEPSGRGWHGHLTVRAKGMSPADFNARLQRLAADLATVLVAQGFQAKVEVRGEMTL